MEIELNSKATIGKERNGKSFTIKGEFDSEQLQKALDRFIDKYVCCQKCILREVNLMIEDGKINGKCKSCGHYGLLDNKHKLANYIIKDIEIGKDDKSKREKKGLSGNDGEVEQKKAAKKRVKKVRFFSDPEIKAFKQPLAECNYTLDPNNETVASLLTKFRTVMEKNRAIEGSKKKEVIQKAYRNLKSLAIPANKQCLYGYLYFNSVFSLNIAKQIEKEAKSLIYFYEVTFNNKAFSQSAADATRNLDLN